MRIVRQIQWRRCFSVTSQSNNPSIPANNESTNASNESAPKKLTDREQRSINLVSALVAVGLVGGFVLNEALEDRRNRAQMLDLLVQNERNIRREERARALEQQTASAH